MIDERSKLQLGWVVITPAAFFALRKALQLPAEFLSRHRVGDWGEVAAEDWKLNDEALVMGERLLSVYRTKMNERIWVITEADRSSTCLLTPDEY